MKDLRLEVFVMTETDHQLNKRWLDLSDALFDRCCDIPSRKCVVSYLFAHIIGQNDV